MEQYIPNSVVLAEIERLIKKNELYLDGNVSDAVRYQKIGAYSVLCDLRHFLDTLEVKEVDLEKEIQRQYNVHKNPDNSIVKDCVIMTKDGFEYFAKHFFELGIAVNNKA